MAGILDRALRVLEMLARTGAMPLHAIADTLDIPRSAAHRLLAEFAQHGYVRQELEGGPYTLTVKFAAMGLSYLARSGIQDLAGPVLERLAAATGELARLSVVEDRRLTWVAKAAGTRHDLRYDPDSGLEVHLASTACGQAWLAGLPEQEALELVASQSRDWPDGARAKARSIPVLLRSLRAVRARGYAIAIETYVPGTAALAAPIRHPGTGGVIGVVNIAGPSARLDERRLHDLAPVVVAAGFEMGNASLASAVFRVATRPPCRQTDGASA